MDPDLSLVIGLFICVFAIPAVVSALSDSRAPRAAAIALMVGGGLVVFAINSKDGGYAVNEIPDVVLDVLGGFLSTRR